MHRFLPAILSVILFCTDASAQSVPTLTFTPVITSGLSQPLDIVRPPEDTTRLFIVGKTGRVRILEAGTTLRADTFLDVSPLIATSGEQGLLSMAFHPQYATNRFFWVLYVNTAGNLVLARYQTLATDANKADASSGVVVLTIPHPSNTNHNGGRLIFGPSDGLLYWSTGDGGAGGDPPNNAQTKSVRLGKMLRLNVTTSSAPPYYTVPPSNPFIGQAGADSLVYQYGLRNPFRWSFDRLNGDMWIADVGQDVWEEVDFTPAASAAGRDWGWRCREGAHTYNTSGSCATGTYTGYTDPVFEYDQDTATGGMSITGGYVYRGTQFPALYGRYICVDYITDNAWTIAPNGSGGFTGTLQSFIPTGIAGFGEDHRGELYAAKLSGIIYRVGAQGGTPLNLAEVAKSSSLLLSPVPVSAGARWTLRGDGLRSAALIDVQGRILLEIPLHPSHNTHSIMVPTVPSGVYFLRVRGVNGSQKMERVVVR